MKPAKILIHLEAGDADVQWWAESAAIAGWSAAAPSLRDLRILIEEAAVEYLRAGQRLELDLVRREDDAAAAAKWADTGTLDLAAASAVANVVLIPAA